MKTTIPWGRSLLLGIIGTLALGGCTPIWMLGQMGGPVPFGYVWIVVTGAALALAVFVLKPRTVIAAMMCGLSFSIPISAFCWVLPTFNSHLDYFKEMRSEAVATIIISIVVMIVAAFHRQLNHPHGSEDKLPK